MKTVCWNCCGNTNLMASCETCGATGVIEERRLHVMTRRKRYVGMGQPGAAASGDEKWTRLVAEVPPEIAAELDRIGKLAWRGHTLKPPSRAAIVRAALLHWMEHHDPEPDAAVEATAEEVFDRLTIAETVEPEEEGMGTKGEWTM